MSSQPLTSLPERRCANCGSVLLTGAPHDCARQHTPEAIAPTLAPDAPVDTAQTPVRVSVQAPEQASSDLVGQVLGERYLIERRLGQGGMGVVFAARHVVLDKQFAVKLLLTPQNEEYQRRFLQEAKLASQISHPNTVFLSDFGVLPDGRSYLVMELLRGTTLSQLLAQGRVEVHRACRIAAQTAHGLQAVHDQGIIHRDLKPENIFLLEQDGKKDFVKIVDFGIAKQATGPLQLAGNKSPAGEVGADSKTNTRALDKEQLQSARLSSKTLPGTLLGTPGYMSPEQALGKAVDFRVDQYSLGCILYELLSGQLPFEEEPVGAMLRRHIEDVPASLCERFPDLELSPSLDAVVLRMLAKKPEQRFPSMREAAQALEHELELLQIQRGDLTVLPTAMASQLNQARNHNTLEQKRREKNRRLLIAGLSVLVVVLLSLPLLRTYWPRKPQVRHAPSQEELAVLRQRALQTLQEQLASGPVELKASALTKLGQTHDAALLPQLQEALKSPEPTLQTQGALALGLLGLHDAAEPLKQLQTTATTEPARWASSSALARLEEPEGIAALGQFLSSADTQLRTRAALQLCQTGHLQAVPVLQALAPSLPSTEEVSAQALGCLVEQGDQPAWQTLQARSTDPALPEQARVWAAAEITRLGGRLGPLTLRSLAEGRGPASDLAAVLLTTPADAKPSERLQASVTSPFESSEQRLLGIQAIMASNDATQAALLSPLLAPISPGVPRQEAASALLHLTSLPPQELAKQSLTWARRSVDSPVLMVQLAGITTLGHLPGPEPLLLLAKQRHDSTELARRAVARALAHRPEQAALTLLLTLLDDSSASVREDALVTLGKLVERRTPASAPVPATLLPRLVTLATSGPPNEQLLAASALAKLGNPYHQTQLNSFQTHQSPQLRALLLQQQPKDAERLASFLADPVLEVRLLAAQRLAVLGDLRALPILKTALEHGGQDADRQLLTALLHRLGEPPMAPTSAAAAEETLACRLPVERRIATVQAMRGLSAEVALPLLLRVAQDPVPLVRVLVAETAAALPSGSAGSPALPLLRQLMQDRSLLVWTKARALLVQLTMPVSPVLEPDLSQLEPAPAPLVASAAAESSQPPDAAGAVASASEGTLHLEVPAGIYFHVDKRPWQLGPASGSLTMPLMPGTHRLHSLSEQQDLVMTAGATTKARIQESPAEKFLHAGLQARTSDSRKAQRQLERARALCLRPSSRESEGPCGSIQLLASATLGELYEEDKQYGEAMTAYQQVLTLSSKVKGQSEAKQAAQLGSSRLSGRVGQVIVGMLVSGRCQPTSYWLNPGQHQVDLGQGRVQTVTVGARQTLELGDCR